MLVVLSMLVLFMLIGTAFLMTSNQARQAAKASAKNDRLGNHATRLLDRALMHALRDTENSHSAIATHSLLRDLYGTDGFQGVVYSPAPNVAFDPAVANRQVTRFAGASTLTGPLGPTQGQFVDIYVRALAWNQDDPLTPGLVRENQGQFALLAPDPRHIVKLDRNFLGQPQLQAMPLTKGYYNGCLMTITSGPAAGQSTRIVGYEHVADIDPTAPNADPPFYTRLFRFRVMAFPRSDGQPLQIGSRQPEIADLANATFIVNGRPFNGTGVGYNPLAGSGQPRLNALQVMPIGTTSSAVGAEIALTPNARFLDYSRVGMHPDPFAPSLVENDFLLLNPDVAPADRPLYWKYQSFAGPGDANESYDAADFQNMFLALLTVSPRARGRVVHNVSGVPQAFEIDDPQVIDANGNFVNTDEFLRLDLEDLPWPSFHRPDLVNFWYHRIFNYLIATGAVQPEDAVPAILHPYGPDGIRGNGDDPTAVGLPLRDLIVSLKRKIMLRPIREDHPNFDGSNPPSVPPDLTDDSENLAATGQISIPYWEATGPWDVDNDNDGVADSVWVDIGDPVIEAEDGVRYKALYAYLIVDLDSRLNVNAHGLADHITPPDLAYAIDINGDFTPLNMAAQASSDFLAQGLGYGPAEISLRPVFPIPWIDPAGTFPDPTLPPNRSEAAGAPIDSYAALLVGRDKLDQSAVSGKWGYQPPAMMGPLVAVTPGSNYMYDSDLSAVPAGAPQLYTGETASPDLLAMLKFFNYPWTAFHPSAFGTPPDLKGRYALGVDYTGQPVYEVMYDVNPSNTALDYNLLANSPYELNLSSPQRRDTMSDIRASYSNSTAKFFGTMGYNDDAAFATTDLERVLRGWDADAGTLPSRLWDVVDAFDPLKLMEYDPHRVTAAANAAFGSASQPERLAAAQQMAAINRHLVTTDSYDLPVPAASVPNPDIYAWGADGYPGRRPSGGGGPPDLTQLNAPISDDFRSLFGKEAAQATIFDLLRYRVWVAVRPLAMQEFGYANEDDLSDLSDADYATFLTRVSQLAEARLNGEPFRDTNGNGIYDTGDTFTASLPPAGHDTNGNGVYDPPMARLLAPEVIAGKRMDLNRPFGDGQDNDGNGVVDDPLEAGDPFLDLNGNGKMDYDTNGNETEPYIDLDGDGEYDAPMDELWAATGAFAEQISFDHTNSQGEPVHPALGRRGALVRNLDSQARQHYARHLYCLMLLLVDQNYIAPVDENDPQIATYLDTTIDPSAAKSVRDALGPNPHPNPTQEEALKLQARQIMRRKLTCRQIAQWAVNCVDMRDADAIMTPFEYDENPWDGWGVPDGNGVNIPLDGDPATDENKGEMINWSEVPNNPNPNTKKLTVLPPAQLPTVLNQTRGLVWGTERPELVISETLATHDRKSTDEPYRGQVRPSSSGQEDEFDCLDQRLKPMGSLFIELYNPWPADGPRPAELYRYRGNVGHRPIPTIVDTVDGVLLHRQSDLTAPMASGPASGPGRSPVWRMAIVKQRDEPILKKYVKPADFNDKNKKFKYSFVDGLQGTVHRPTPEFFTLDPDHSTFDSDRDAQRWVYFTPPPKQVRYSHKTNAAATTWTFFTRGQDPGGLDAIRIPSAPAKTGMTSVPLGKQYFLASDRGDTPAAWAIDADPNIPNNSAFLAPIMPGCYAVVGSAGTQYKALERVRNAGGNPMVGHPRFVTTIGRIRDKSSPRPTASILDTRHLQQLDETRRIELLPQRDPFVQQLLVGKNGGSEMIEITNNKWYNITDDQYEITDPSHDETDEPIASQNIKNCVAIPIEGLNVSEPVAGYIDTSTGRPWPDSGYLGDDANEGRQIGRNDVGEWEFQIRGPGKISDQVDPPKQDPRPFVVPLDNELALMRNGTTANYCTVHLQRLANPLLPWNPEPRLSDGTQHPDYNEALPVNPYLTIDSMSTDLTAFNGVEDRERTELPTKSSGHPQNEDKTQEDDRATPDIQFHQTKRILPYDPLTLGTIGKPKFEQKLHLKSLERGYHTKVDDARTIERVKRSVWAHEPANNKEAVGVPGATAPKGENPSGGDLFNTPHTDQRKTQLMADGVDNDAILAMTPSDEHVFDYVLEHTLGFQNTTFGEFYTAGEDGVAVPPVPASAFGSPKLPYTYTNAAGTVDVFSTFPWLAWNNRPFVSGKELMSVPAASSSQMFRSGYYSTINPNEPPPTADQPVTNPYGNDGRFAVEGTPPLLYQSSFPFGHLLPFFSAAAQRPDFYDEDTDPDATKYTAHPTDPMILKPPDPALAPHFYRILEYVQVPSRYVGTETMLNAETFNDVPGGADIIGPADPRSAFQPPFNQVSRERDPGRVNLNTVTGRRIPGDPSIPSPPQIWSEVYDGIMHRYRDDDLRDNTAALNLLQYGHSGPAWRDVALSRRGYAQLNAPSPTVPPSVDKPNNPGPPDTFQFGLNNSFPTVFANPFRSPGAGDMVPLVQMMQYGVDATYLRNHPYKRDADQKWGDAANPRFNDARDAGFGDDTLSYRPNWAIPSDDLMTPGARDTLPLFSEARAEPFSDTDRNPYMMYQPMTRLGNLVTNRSNVFAIWITVGYFEVEKAPAFDDVSERFGGDGTANSPATQAAQALYNRVYPDGYMLGREVGSETGDVKRARGFYIVDRTEEVGFKPGEDLNVEKTIRLRRRIE